MRKLLEMMKMEGMFAAEKKALARKCIGALYVYGEYVFMYLYVHVCVCVYIYIYIYIYTDVHIYNKGDISYV